MNPAARQADVVILGAGLAGAATAFFLARARGLTVLVLEQETEIGAHSSGRNAALIRTCCGDPELDALAREGAAFVARPPGDFPGPVGFRRTGSLLVGRAEVLDGLAAGGGHRQPLAGPGWFRAAPGQAALHCPHDGVVDVQALLQGFLRGATRRGTVLERGVRAHGIVTRAGRVTGVECDAGHVTAGRVVLAAGAWCEELARGAGAAGAGLVPYRRHLAVTGATPFARADEPFLWDLERGFYARAEGAGMLLCPCDEEATEPGPCPADPAVLDLLAARVAQCAPGFAGLEVRRWWAGLRTRRADSRFVLGADPTVRGLYWAAGLGGHGVTCAAAVGRRVAAAVLGSGRVRTAGT